MQARKCINRLKEMANGNRGCFTGTDPITDSTALGSVAKFVESGTNSTKKA